MFNKFEMVKQDKSYSSSISNTILSDNKVCSANIETDNQIKNKSIINNCTSDELSLSKQNEDIPREIEQLMDHMLNLAVKQDDTSNEIIQHLLVEAETNSDEEFKIRYSRLLEEFKQKILKSKTQENANMINNETEQLLDKLSLKNKNRMIHEFIQNLKLKIENKSNDVEKIIERTANDQLSTSKDEFQIKNEPRFEISYSVEKKNESSVSMTNEVLGVMQEFISSFSNKNRITESLSVSDLSINKEEHLDKITKVKKLLKI